jgi:hypothetical protein
MALSLALIFQGSVVRSLSARLRTWTSALPPVRLPGLGRA